MPRVSCRRNMLHLFAPENFPVRKALRNQLGHIRGCPKRLAVSPECQSANSQDLLRRRIRAGDNSSSVHHQQPRRHVPCHFFAQPLRLFRAFSFNAMQPLQFLFLLLPRALKKLPHQKHRQPRDHQEPNSQSRGNHPKVLRVISSLEHCEHRCCLSAPSSLTLCPSVFGACPDLVGVLSVLNLFRFQPKILESRDYATIPLRLGQCPAITGPPYTIASAPIPRNVPSGNWYCLAIAHRRL